MAKLSKFVKNNLFTEEGGFILDARQAKVLYDLINQITGGGSYLMVGGVSVNNIADLNTDEYLLKEPGNYGLFITNGFGGANNMNLTVAFNSTQTSGSSGLQDFIQTIKVGEKEYVRTIGHTQVGEVISINYSSWVDTKLPYNRFVSLQEPTLVQPYQIGDLVEGGIVYYILKDGDVGYDPSKQKGLVVSPVGQGEFAWNNEEYVLTGADKTTIGYGYSNSIDIVIAQTGTVYNYAARKCIDLVLGGYSDWYLPAMGELLKLYANKVEAGITDLPVGLWSSSEYDLSYAVLVYNALEYNTTEKNQQWQVRAIRSFSVDLSLKSEEDDEIMISTGVDKEIKGSGKKLSDIMNILNNPEKIVKSLHVSNIDELNRVDLSSGQYSLTGGIVGSLLVTNEKDGDTLVGVLQELNDGDVIMVREIVTIPNVAYGDWVTKSITEEQKANSHEPHSDDQDLSGLVEKVEGEGLLPTTEREKLAQLDPLPSIPIGQVRKDDGKFHNITHQQVTELNTDPDFQHIDSTTERATIIDADALVIWNSITGKSEVTTYSHFKANLANNFVVKDIGNAGSATKLQTARNINGVAFDGTQDITINAVDITSRIATSLMGVANGVATLDGNGIILTSQLPSYIDDILEFTNLGSFPIPGETGKIYVAKDTNKTYRWGGSTYVYITSGAVDSVNGYTGVVVLSKSDVGLSNVVNALQWHDGNHPVTVGGYGLPTYPTTLPASDVYTWAKASTKPSYSYTEITGKPTLLSQFTNDLGNYGGWITGINSGMVTTALGYTPLSTRTFGTAANSAVGDFIQNQNASAQSANMWISGSGIFNGKLGVGSTINNGWGASLNVIEQTGGSIISWSGSDANISLVTNVYDDGVGNKRFKTSSTIANSLELNTGGFKINAYGSGATGSVAPFTNLLSITQAGAATFASSVNATQLQSTVATGTAPLTVNSITMVGNLNAEYFGGSQYKFGFFPNGQSLDATYYSPTGSDGYGGILRLNTQGPGGGYYYDIFASANLGSLKYRGVNPGNAGTWTTIWDSSNLTNTLSTNYIPKWNGSTMVNSLINDDGSDNAYYYIGTANQGGINLKRSGGSVYGKFGIEQFGVNNDTYIGSFSNNGFGLYSAGTKRLYIRYTGEVDILSTTASTSPATGALVVGGGIGVAHINIGDADGLRFRSTDSYISGYATGTSTRLGYVQFRQNALKIVSESTSNLINLNESAGNVNIGYTTDQGYRLAVNGTGFFNGVVTGTTFQNSDRRLKSEIKSVVGNYEIETMQFEYKDNIGVTRYGYIAQDIQKILPNLVHERPDGMLTVNITDVHSLEIHQLKNRIKILEEKLYGRS